MAPPVQSNRLKELLARHRHRWMAPQTNRRAPKAHLAVHHRG
jgi:hypothetical protein